MRPKDTVSDDGISGSPVARCYSRRDAGGPGGIGDGRLGEIPLCFFFLIYWKKRKLAFTRAHFFVHIPYFHILLESRSYSDLRDGNRGRTLPCGSKEAWDGTRDAHGAFTESAA